MKENYVMTIKAEDRSGLIHLVTGMMEKRQVKIISLTYAPTDIHGTVLITIEFFGEEITVRSLSLKLKNIVEVFGVEVSRHESALCLRAPYFKISKAFLETPEIGRAHV